VRILALPLPIFVASLADSLTMPELSGPAWAQAIMIGMFVFGYFLNLVGKFPGAGGERREASFTGADRTRLDTVYEVVTREDSDKPGWRMVWHPARETREMRDLLIELSDLREDWAAERAECKEDRAKMIVEHEQERHRWHERLSRLEDANARYESALRHGAGGGA
jgi:hypothetical protein